MPRDLVIGNGSLQVMFDAAYRLRDVYFPNLGKENHTVGYPCRFGVFADRRLSWIDSPEWERQIGYKPDALVTDVTLTHRQFTTRWRRRRGPPASGRGPGSPGEAARGCRSARRRPGSAAAPRGS